jgi:hypothetical protein
MASTSVGRTSTWLWLGAGALAATVGLACGSSESASSSEPPGTAPRSSLRVLARNVLLGPAPSTASLRLRTANAGGGVDDTTKLPAANVVYERSLGADLESGNVQAALEELAVKLDVILPGTWTIENKNQEASHAATGAITVNADGTFDLTAGSFAAIGMGSSTECGHVGPQTFELFSPRVALFRHQNGSTPNSAMPTLIEAKPGRLVFIGTGGCGEMGRPRVSILTRVGGGADAGAGAP